MGAPNTPAGAPGPSLKAVLGLAVNASSSTIGGLANNASSRTILVTGWDTVANASNFIDGFGGDFAYAVDNVNAWLGPGLKLTPLTTFAETKGKTAFSSVNLQGKLVHFVMFIPPVLDILTLNLSLQLYTSAGLAAFALTPNQIRAGLNTFTLLVSNDTSAAYSRLSPGGAVWTGAGAADFTAVTNVGLIVNTTSGNNTAGVYPTLYEVSYGGKGRPFLIMGSDGDGYTNTQQYALPRFEAVGLKGYKACDGDTLAANRKNVDGLAAAGWDIISQGQTHVSYITGATSPGVATTTGSNNLTGTGEPRLAPDIRVGLAALESAYQATGYPGYRSGQSMFAYPQNANSYNTDFILHQAGIQYARAFRRNNLSVLDFGIDNLVSIGGIGMETLTTQDLMSAVVDRLIAYGGVSDVFIHQLSPTQPTGTAVGDGTAYVRVSSSTSTDATLEYFLAYAKKFVDAGLLDWGSPSQFLRRQGLPLLPCRPVPLKVTGAAYTTTYTDLGNVIRCDATAQAQTITLLAANLCQGQTNTVKKLDNSANATTVVLADGGNVVLSSQNSSVTTISNGVTHDVIGKV